MAETKEKSPTILIVEDDESVRNILQDYVANHGYQTYCAISSNDALDYLISGNIDLVITDIGHPGIDGLELIRRMKTFCFSDFIVMSGTISRIHTPEECFDAGANAVIKKPAKLFDILDTVNCLLEKKLSANHRRL